MFFEKGGLLNIFLIQGAYFRDLGRFGGRIWAIFANLGVILGPILDPGGRMGPFLDPLKNSPKKSRLASFVWGRFWAQFGSILVLFLELFWHRFLDLVFWHTFWSFLGPFWDQAGP